MTIQLWNKQMNHKEIDRAVHWMWASAAIMGGVVVALFFPIIRDSIEHYGWGLRMIIIMAPGLPILAIAAVIDRVVAKKYIRGNDPQK
jgi:hypothetical protein